MPDLLTGSWCADLIELVVCRPNVDRLVHRHAAPGRSLLVHADDHVALPLPARHHRFARAEQAEQAGQVLVVRERCGRSLTARPRPGRTSAGKTKRARGSAGCSRRSAPGRTAETAAAPPCGRAPGSRSGCPARAFSGLEIAAGQADLADAVDEALRLQPLLDLGEAGDALLRGAGHRVEEDLLVRAARRTRGSRGSGPDRPARCRPPAACRSSRADTTPGSAG